ncbi:hypothetical protein VTN77DRAFT_3415 [Rasamsonia byssochlamydoides]|uniref:uncharacterized protein n=1 Tax=Rasamsonia byssochlamydoides TaxID=89139 RepID=UPI003743E138
MALLSMWRRLLPKRTVAVVTGLITLAFLLHFWEEGEQFLTFRSDNFRKTSPDHDFYSTGTYSLPGGQLGGSFFHRVRTHPIPIPYDPYSDYSGDAGYRPCLGPRGNLLDRTNPEDMMFGYRWNVSAFPSPVFGSYEAVPLDRSICTDRYSRYGAYGYGEREQGEVPGFQKPSPVEWDSVDWDALQQDCLQRNAHRYDHVEQTRQRPWGLHRENEALMASSRPNKSRSRTRTAVILRSSIGMNYTENDLHNIRAIVMELALFSGAEYEVFLLIDTQDAALPDLEDEAAVKKLKESTLPRELHGLAVFFNHEILQAWYPKLPEHRAILQYFQPLQIFAHLHPEFDFFWQFEMDARYTGHLYHLLEQAASFARMQPRKFLWERNSYFYMSRVHGTWDEFVQRVDRDMAGRESIWGPLPARNITPNDIDNRPTPPTDPADDRYEWGVGEEADLITWLPTFDPEHTDWPFRNEIYNFEQGVATPRRTAVVTMSRVSSRLLRAMHRDQTEKGVGLASEMSAVSWAMYYGLKVVQIPQPLYLEGGDWEEDISALERRVNSGSPEKINARWESIWSWGQHDDILYHMTYMFRSVLPEKIYRVWLGYKTDGGKGGSKWEKKYGRLCLPPMFLHPVKNVA